MIDRNTRPSKIFLGSKKSWALERNRNGRPILIGCWCRVPPYSKPGEGYEFQTVEVSLNSVGALFFSPNDQFVVE